MKDWRWILFIGLLAGAGAPSAAPAETHDLQASFQVKTQALFDAITHGDRALWDRTMDADCVITTEDGEVQNKAKFLEGIKGLPKGFVGDGKIRDLTVRQFGDAAVVHYFIAETEDIFEQHLRTGYIETDVYQKHAGDWKMVSQQVTVVPRDMEPVAVNTKGFGALMGDYHFPGDEKVRYHVFTRDGKLFGGRDEKSATELIPLSPLVFYQQGSIHVMVFVQGAGAAVSEVREIHKYNEVRMLHVQTSTEAAG